ncbi:carotenoid oxygenase family protein [Mycolicibacterium sp. CH28]|uniref:carotenoid oxygenase family protein n=1 Tax=Mycolicibacterium sp. CH28 TaxID=2512237 RepID=UPI0010815E85|nr:carotenoid oxygenase family protein [Mycolicibacterium sp. CH28]TGD90042.1 carotenoid oxygenase family protein [Mycolicibacterium sp. CH28]
MNYSIPDSVTLKGPFWPMRFEATVEECIVTHGEIPKDLAGGLYRTGPCWKRPTAQGSTPLLAMDGMLQGLVFESGRADFRNRWVRTPKYLLEDRHRKGMFEYTDGGFGDYRDYGYGDVKRTPENAHTPQGTTNINIFPFAGNLVVSSEVGGPPMVIDPITLETKQVVDWAPALAKGLHDPVAFGDGSFCAHPKWDEDTGVLYGWSYSDTAPYVSMKYVHPDGTVESRDLWDAPYNAVAHDIWLSPEWVVMPFQPFIIDRARIDKGLPIFGWEPELPITIALIPRHDLQGEIRWIKTDLPAQYIMHTMTANVRANKLLLDGPIFQHPPFPLEDEFSAGDTVALFFSNAPSYLGRWTVDLTTGKTTSEQLSELPSEISKVDQRFYGKGHRYGFQIGGKPKKRGMRMDSLIRNDVENITEEVFQIRGAGELAAIMEGSFAPRSLDAPEGDGYIIVPVSRWAENRGEFQIFDTDDITAGPICTIELPFHMGWTPHGHWMDFR